MSSRSLTRAMPVLDASPARPRGTPRTARRRTPRARASRGGGPCRRTAGAARRCRGAAPARRVGMPSGRACTAGTSSPSTTSVTGLDRDVVDGAFAKCCHAAEATAAGATTVSITSSDRGSTSPRHARQAVLDRAGAGLADTFDLDEVGDARAHDLGQRAEALDHVVGDRLGQARDLAEQPVAARLQRRVEVELGREVQQRRDDAQVEQLVVGDVGEARGRPASSIHSRRLDEVVLADEPQVVATPRR